MKRFVFVFFVLLITSAGFAQVKIDAYTDIIEIIELMGKPLPESVHNISGNKYIPLSCIRSDGRFELDGIFLYCNNNKIVYQIEYWHTPGGINDYNLELYYLQRRAADLVGRGATRSQRLDDLLNNRADYRVNLIFRNYNIYMEIAGFDQNTICIFETITSQ